MARIRSNHPSRWTDEEFVDCSIISRLALFGIENEADDYGVFEWKPRSLKMRILPADNCDFSEILDDLASNRKVQRFEFDGKAYGAIRNFCKFQSPQKPTQKHPLPRHLYDYVGYSGPELAKGASEQEPHKSSPPTSPVREEYERSIVPLSYQYENPISDGKGIGKGIGKVESYPQQPESLTHARVAAAEEDRGRELSDQPDRGDEAERPEAVGTSPPPLVEVVDWDIAPPHDIQRSDIDPAIRRSLVEHCEMRGANPVTVSKRIDAWLRAAPPEFIESKIMRAVSDRSIRNALGWIDRCVDDWIRAQHEQAEAAREKPFDPIAEVFKELREKENANGDLDRGSDQANSILRCSGEGRGSGGFESASCTAR